MAQVARLLRAAPRARAARARLPDAPRTDPRDRCSASASATHPNSWNEVLRRFGAADADRRRLAEAGLIIERERGQGQAAERHYDRFRDRIMFPIRDAPRTRHRLRRPRDRCGRAQVPELTGDGVVPQGARALWSVRDAPRAFQPRAPVGRRRLHGRRTAASGGYRLRGGDARHRHHPRAFPAHLPAGARGGVCLRRRSRRSGRRMARAAAGAAGSTRRP